MPNRATATEESAQLETAIKTMLYFHEGAETAITAKAITISLGMESRNNDRPVREAIRNLIAQGVPIAASPKGYFLILTREEAREYADSLKGRLIEDALRRRDFRRAADQWLTPAMQGELKL